jgi:hypothetical protein
MLLFLKFLIRVAEYASMVNRWRGKTVTESQSVLKTLGGDVDIRAADDLIQIDGSTVVLDVLCPDWDILIEIQHSLLQLPGSTLQYIKAHKDNDTLCALFPTMLAQLYVNADTCSQISRSTWMHLTHTPHDTKNASSDPSPKGSVTGKFTAALRNAYCGPPLLKSLKLKYKCWSDKTIEPLHTETHGSCIRIGINRSIKKPQI